MIHITLDAPRSVDSKKVRAEIVKLINSGHKSSEISWEMDFIASEEMVNEISNKFRILVNRIAFEADINDLNKLLS